MSLPWFIVHYVVVVYSKSPNAHAQRKHVVVGFFVYKMFLDIMKLGPYEIYKKNR